MLLSFFFRWLHNLFPFQRFFLFFFLLSSLSNEFLFILQYFLLLRMKKLKRWHNRFFKAATYSNITPFRHTRKHILLTIPLIEKNYTPPIMDVSNHPPYWLIHCANRFLDIPFIPTNTRISWKFRITIIRSIQLSLFLQLIQIFPLHSHPEILQRWIWHTYNNHSSRIFIREIDTFRDFPSSNTEKHSTSRLFCFDSIITH